jgi:hypothetical protein
VLQLGCAWLLLLLVVLLPQAGQLRGQPVAGVGRATATARRGAVAV